MVQRAVLLEVGDRDEERWHEMDSTGNMGMRWVGPGWMGANQVTLGALRRVMLPCIKQTRGLYIRSKFPYKCTVSLDITLPMSRSTTI